MTRFSLLLASLTVGLTTSASALVGGPFDNNDYSSLLDNSGVYQVAFRFRNGSGFAQFGNNVDIALYVDISAAGAGTGNSVRGTTYSVLNRSLIYYKGVTFLGTAAGMVDHEAKRVTGVTNGSSDVALTGQTASSGTTNSVTAATTTLINNNSLAFPCNTTFTAKITKSAPVLRFAGTGELTVLTPTLVSIANTALQSILTNFQPSPLTPLSTTLQQLVTGIQTVNDNSELFAPTLESVSEQSDKVKMTVYGSRVFFVGRR